MRRTESTAELLVQLHGNEPGFQPDLLTAWSPELTAQDDISLPLLTAVLDEPLALRTPRTGRPPARRLTWHCAIRNTTTVQLDDDPSACRWVALRNQADGLDIVATVIRQDGRWARLHGDADFARPACTSFAHDHGLHPSA